MSENRAFEKSMNNATVELVEKMAKRMAKACAIVEGTAKVCCPVDMGVLRASIRFQVKITTEVIEGLIGSNMEYAPYVHQGTGIYAADGNGRKTPWGYLVKTGKYKGYHVTQGQKPNPFLADAFYGHKQDIEKILGGGEWS